MKLNFRYNISTLCTQFWLHCCCPLARPCPGDRVSVGRRQFGRRRQSARCAFQAVERGRRRGRHSQDGSSLRRPGTRPPELRRVIFQGRVADFLKLLWFICISNSNGTEGPQFEQGKGSCLESIMNAKSRRQALILILVWRTPEARRSRAPLQRQTAGADGATPSPGSDDDADPEEARLSGNVHRIGALVYMLQ